MPGPHHGSPCWYELTTAPGALDAAQRFYAAVLGWHIADAGMAGFDYRLASAGDDRVAGLMAMPADVAAMPPFWMLYFAVDDADKAVAQMTKAKARLHRPVTEIPGTGRFALLADPQGAGFGILEPLPGQAGGAMADKPGHGMWHELMTSAPKSAMKFYARAFGWKPGRSMDMGAMGSYDLFQWDGRDIGGMMKRAPQMPGPKGSFWMPYFGVTGVAAAMERIGAGGGTVLHGPQEVPGGAFIAVARDPQGAQFAVVGPK